MVDFLIRDIDEKTYRAFKAKAALEGVKLKDAALEALREWLLNKKER